MHGTEEIQLAGETVDLGRQRSAWGSVAVKGDGHTTASCSFSSWLCRSAAVKGSGKRAGPGPDGSSVVGVMFGGRDGGGTSGGLAVLLTARWFEGRMLLVEGEAGTGGGGICWEETRRMVAAWAWPARS